MVRERESVGCDELGWQVWGGVQKEMDFEIY